MSASSYILFEQRISIECNSVNQKDQDVEELRRQYQQASLNDIYSL